MQLPTIQYLLELLVLKLLRKLELVWEVVEGMRMIIRALINILVIILRSVAILEGLVYLSHLLILECLPLLLAELILVEMLANINEFQSLLIILLKCGS
jgi:hypothetical protein